MAGDEDAADHQIGPGAIFLDGAGSRVDGLERGAEAADQLLHPLDTLFDDDDVGAHAECHRGGIGADHAAADDDHARRSNAGHAAEQHAATPLRLLQAVGAGLDRHPAGHLRHRRQQRQPAARAGDRLIGDAHRARCDEILGLLGIGGEMEIGVEDLAGAQHLALVGLGLLDLHDHVGPFENLL